MRRPHSGVHFAPTCPLGTMIPEQVHAGSMKYGSSGRGRKYEIPFRYEQAPGGIERNRRLARMRRQAALGRLEMGLQGIQIGRLGGLGPVVWAEGWATNMSYRDELIANDPNLMGRGMTRQAALRTVAKAGDD